LFCHAVEIDRRADEYEASASWSICEKREKRE
jgi:hypothetical protein